jgi:hypothetical protein
VIVLNVAYYLSRIRTFHSRTVHSLVLLLALYENVRLLLVAPAGLEMPAALVEELAGRLDVHTATLVQVRRCDRKLSCRCNGSVAGWFLTLLAFVGC